MGLEKTYEIKQYGVTANYWNVRSIHVDKAIGRVIVEMNCYLNYQAREEGKMPLTFMTFEFPIEEYTEERNLFKWVYQKLHETELFKDAEDVFEEEPDKVRKLEF